MDGCIETYWLNGKLSSQTCKNIHRSYYYNGILAFQQETVSPNHSICRDWSEAGSIQYNAAYINYQMEGELLEYNHS